MSKQSEQSSGRGGRGGKSNCNNSSRHKNESQVTEFKDESATMLYSLSNKTQIDIYIWVAADEE